MAVLAALAALDAQQHALGIDIADLERDDFGNAKPGAAGSRRGWRTTVSRRARSGRSSVTVKKKRRAEAALLMRGGCMPLCVW